MMILRKLKCILFLIVTVGINLTLGQTNIIPISSVDMNDMEMENSCPSYPERLVIRNVTEHNFLGLEHCVRSYFESLPIDLRNEVLPVDDAVRDILRMMNELLENGTDPSCFTGEIEYIEETRDEYSTTVDFLWNGSLSSTSEYSGAFVDLDIDRELPFAAGQTNSQQQRYSITVPGRLSHKCYAVNGLCDSDLQSSFHFIIIIETDIRLDEDMPEVPDDTPPVEIGGGGAMASASGELKVFPNPVKEQPSTLEFELYKEQAISIHIMNNTGQIIRSAANNETFATGIHHVQLETKNLSPGIYFVVLEREGKQSIRKLVIL